MLMRDLAIGDDYMIMMLMIGLSFYLYEI
jgi:hypothetical protein